MGLSLLGLMACGQKTDNSGGNSSEGSGTTARESAKETAKAEGENNSDVTLSVSIWDTNQEPGLEEIMADFTKETGIKTKITVVRWADYWTAMEAAAQGGSLPDVFWMHSNESERYMSNGMLLDLTDYIKNSEVIKKEYYPTDIWSLYGYEGKDYAVPKDIDTIALWYNKKMFDEAGLAYPTADWTWDDLTEAARKLKKPDGSQYGFCLKPNNDQAGYYNMILDRGGYILNDDKTKSGYDDPKSIEAMQILETWIKEDLIPSAETMSENSEDVLFQSGKVAMIYSEKYHFYKFPGGGIEGDETHLETLKREIKEETGMILKPESVREFGEVLLTQKMQKNGKDVILVQYNYYYLCETENEIGTQSLDDGEKELGFVLKFVSIDEAIRANNNFQGEPIEKNTVERENRILELVKNL